MFIEKNYSFERVVRYSGRPFLLFAVYSTTIVLLWEYANLNWITIPWLPLSLIGTAVAFYVGFKNNSSYDRMWEARKIWGAIVNSSRAWGTYVGSFVSNQFAAIPASKHELQAAKTQLIYRHIAWLYALRNQLLVVTNWEHANQRGKTGKRAQRYREAYGIGQIEDEVMKNELQNYLPHHELQRLVDYQNTATQIIDQQAKDLAQLRSKELIDDFRHMELQKLLYDFYEHQGKCERIKKFPLPRQYASVTRIFIYIFIFLLPLGMVSEFAKIGDWGIWLSIPFTALVSWVFWMMEEVGDYSENPFQGMGNDIPMLSLCRVIEIDLKEMLGETDLPEKVKPVNGVLM
ncbi:MAG: bestrophin family ion channel [Bacteroidota bacterium]